MTELVRLDAVTKRYATEGPPALDGVSLSIDAGEAVAVMGPSGSGKSTLLNLVAGLDRPTSGTVVVGGDNVGSWSETKLAVFRRKRVGIVFQFFHLLDDLTVRDNIVLPARLAGVSKKTARERSQALLARLMVADKAEAYPARLSGGERQRVAIARALVNRPVLLLADEPTGAVDARAGVDITTTLRDLNHRGQTLLLVTHDPSVADACATRVIELADGRVVSDSARTARRP